ncbi:MAG: hypothetical protein R3E68_20280 [Burkholderiaceae bacterium]
MIAPDAGRGTHLFPRPWPKKRHHKRRSIQPPFVELLSSRLAPGGYLHCATDWMPYAEQMLQVLTGCAALRNRADGIPPATRHPSADQVRGAGPATGTRGTRPDFRALLTPSRSTAQGGNSTRRQYTSSNWASNAKSRAALALAI